ncbi:hypothetical protein FNV43_RR26196 [Rhamnella rubrinervis]|uniref:Amino acid transporter transmembrane domain-containing protein n=1 Tax=Rhamnella rubrinervis TaxID=2594499 RepID=A0A8K0DIC9_9ROSA|nr:hypothetical protein FNV43_RR26196 [Rhamnella rubrinervis]
MERQEQASQPQQLGKGTTILRTCFNGINALSGVGILSVPYALSQGGWVALVFLFTVALVCWYTGILLKRCMDVNPKIKTYPDIGQAAYGPKGRALVSAFIYVELFAVAVEFLILEGDTLCMLLRGTSFRVGALNIERRVAFILLASLVILPTTWLKNLGVFAYVSAGGVLASFLLVICVFWTGAFGGVGFNEADMLVDFKGIPIATSLFVFCYCGHAVFPTLCDSMKDRSQFSKVLLICFITTTINYGSMAIIGYMMYGEYLKSQVTLNLPLRQISTKIAIYTTLINPLTKYAIMISPIASAIEDKFFFKASTSISILIRTLIVISSVLVALTIPFFGYVMAFIGAFLSVAGAILLPCMCYLKINKVARKFGFELVVIIGIIVAGSFIGAVGTYISAKQIVTHF